MNVTVLKIIVSDSALRASCQWPSIFFFKQKQKEKLKMNSYFHSISSYRYIIFQGYNSPREFVVTQGPLHSTRDDFWRMVWESNSRAIIMLTRCVEKGREKCDHYWPYDTMPVYYGDISVQILNESRYPDWNVTELMVCRVSNYSQFFS